MDTFKEWWADQSSIDYDEMVIAQAAWDYQQKRIDDIKKKNAEDSYKKACMLPD